MVIWFLEKYNIHYNYDYQYCLGVYNGLKTTKYSVIIVDHSRNEIIASSCHKGWKCKLFCHYIKFYQ